MNKKVSIFYFYLVNLTIFLSFAISMKIMNTRNLKPSFILLVLIILSVFETFFFYRKSNNSFKKLEAKDTIYIAAISSMLTILVGLTGIFIINLLMKAYF